jgi:hypothetical protein
MGEPGPDAHWPVAEWFAGADANGDGAIDFAEFEADGHRWFAHLDQNGDGRLGYSELSAYERSLQGMRGFQASGPRGPAGEGGPPPRMNAAPTQSGPRPGGGGGPGGRGRGGQQGYGRIADAGFFNLPQPVKGADTDIDQQVTGEEWAQATNRWFLALDTDRDGRLTLATLPMTPLQRQATERPPVFSLGRGG